ncbi:hypothetical protein CASFOL_040749 [Castilleja foliolosa]|uniref:Uncharacterized protein n=1 Tax=Castilleja foliolosa TaxID=1961234 RepID=A0ABD3BCI1_9LAMI
MADDDQTSRRRRRHYAKMYRKLNESNLSDIAFAVRVLQDLTSQEIEEEEEAAESSSPPLTSGQPQSFSWLLNYAPPQPFSRPSTAAQRLAADEMVEAEIWADSCFQTPELLA